MKRGGLPEGTTVLERMIEIAGQHTETVHLADSTPLPADQPRHHRGGITDEQARAKNRALDIFRNWLLTHPSADLEAADPAKLAQRYPPLDPDDIAQMIRVRARGLRKRAAAG